MKRMLVIRIDDVCPQMEGDWFERIMALLEEYNVTGLLGVIPECQDPMLNVGEFREKFWDDIHRYQKMGWCIAMHGYTHKYDTKALGLVVTEKTKESEFAGHTFEEQLERLKKGKCLLQEKNIHTDIFFAPSHNYDKNTIRALRELGFHYMSDGRSRYAYRRMGIKFIPNSREKQASKGIHTLVLHPCMTKERCYNNLKNRLECGGAQEILPFQTLLEDDDPCNRSHWLVSQLLEEKIYVFFQRARCMGSRVKQKLRSK